MGNIAQIVKDQAMQNSSLVAAIGLALTEVGALWHGIKNMNETYAIVKDANKRLNEYKTRFQEEVLNRLTKMDKQIDAIEETVNNVQMGDEAKITTLERQFNLAYDDASRTENAINSFQRDFESSMTGKE